MIQWAFSLEGEPQKPTVLLSKTDISEFWWFYEHSLLKGNPKNHQFYKGKLTFLGLDDSMSILSWRGTSCCNVKGAALCRRPLSIPCGYQKLSFVRFSAPILVPWGEARRARGGLEPDFHWFGVNFGVHPHTKTISFTQQNWHSQDFHSSKTYFRKSKLSFRRKMDLGKSEFPFRWTKGFGKVKISISSKEKGMRESQHVHFLEKLEDLPPFSSEIWTSGPLKHSFV